MPSAGRALIMAKRMIPPAAQLMSAFSLFLMVGVALAEDSPTHAAKPVRKPRDSRTLQVGSRRPELLHIKESLKSLDPILFPTFRGDQGVVTFVAAALMLKRVGVRVEAAQLNCRGSRINASGLRFGLTAR